MEVEPTGADAGDRAAGTRRIAEVFDRLAPIYDSYFAAGSPLARDYDAHLAFLRGLCRTLGKPRVLDVGSGTGRHLRDLAADISEGVGVDLAPAMVARARANAQAAGCRNVRFAVCEAAALDAGALGLFDLVVFAGALEHALDPVAALRAARSVVAARGRVAVIMPHKANFAFLWQRIATGRRPVVCDSDRQYGVRDLGGVARRAGLAVAAVHALPFAVTRADVNRPPSVVRLAAALAALVPAAATRGAFAMILRPRAEGG